eukprot:6559913-Pyramimonas_sp.AAC.1
MVLTSLTPEPRQHICDPRSEILTVSSPTVHRRLKRARWGYVPRTGPSLSLQEITPFICRGVHEGGVSGVSSASL